MTFGNSASSSNTDSGSARPADKHVVLTTPARGRVQKIFNFSPELAHRLRDEAARRSRESGTRVTEKGIVVEALEARLSACM